AEAASTLCIRWWSTNGPFLSERGMAVILDGHPDPANRPAWPDYKSTPTIAHDELLRALVVACLVTLGRDTPRGNRMRVALAGLGFTTAVRMVDRIHGCAAHGRANAAPAARAGLAELLEAVFGVARLADRRTTFGRHPTHLARTQAQRGVALLTRNELRGSTRSARDLRALAGLHLDAVHGRADRDVAQRQRVADLDRRLAAGHELVAVLRALGRDDVAALAVRVTQQGNVRGPIRIVLDPLDT